MKKKSLQNEVEVYTIIILKYNSTKHTDGNNMK